MKKIILVFTETAMNEKVERRHAKSLARRSQQTNNAEVKQ